MRISWDFTLGTWRVHAPWIMAVMGVSINAGTPIAGWFISGKSHLEMDDELGGTPIDGNPHMEKIWNRIHAGHLQ